MRTRKDKFDVRESVVDNALEDGINRSGVRHGFEIGVLIDDDNNLLGQRIEISEYILQRAKAQRHRQNLGTDKLLHKAIDIVLHYALQALKVHLLILAALKCFSNESSLSNAALAVNHNGLSDIIFLQKS